MLSEDLQSLEVYINKMKDKCVSPTGRGAVAGGGCGPGGCSGDLLELHMCERKAPSQSLTAGPQDTRRGGFSSRRGSSRSRGPHSCPSSFHISRLLVTGSVL